MTKYTNFIFKDYEFDKESKELSLFYSYDNLINFCEVYKFNFDFVDYSNEALTLAIELLFFLAGVSYYKMYLASNIVIDKGSVNKGLASFLKNTYENGLKEFLYVNELDLNYSINFPVNSNKEDIVEFENNGLQLIGIGGGKDSLVSIELLRKTTNIASWSLNHITQLTPLIDKVGLPHYWVERKLDSKLLENNKDFYNGHIPISAIISAVSIIVCVLSGYRDSVFSNEISANEPTLKVNGTEINHQYSKTSEFENDLQKYLYKIYKDKIRYYSLLRPFRELRIAEIFSIIGFEKYKNVFSSCNKAFKHGQYSIFWCGECPKCAFVFLILNSFIHREELETIWHGKNLLLDPSLEKTYLNLLGIAGDKPLDCVGEIKESRTAMLLVQKIYPELNKYKFEIPIDYDYKSLSIHQMPQDIYDKLISSVNRIFSSFN